MEKYLKRIIIFFILAIAGVGILIVLKGAKMIHVVGSGESLFDPSKDKRWDILVLGNRGETAPSGGVLTDSIILLSYEKDTKKAAIFSIPRDLWVEIPNYGYQKINFAYAAGYNSTGDSKKGIQVAKEVIENITGITPDAVVVVDIEALEKLVDAVGGVTIYEDKWFYADFYGRYVQIYPGENHLNGSQALAYVGTRKIDSDFGRMRRQQKVLLSLKDKVVSIEGISRPDRLLNIFSIVEKHIRTDLNASQIKYLIQHFSNIEVDSIEQVVLDTTNYLYSSTSYNGAYILLPKTEDYSEIKNVFQNVFEEDKANEVQPTSQYYQNYQQEEKINKVGK